MWSTDHLGCAAIKWESIADLWDDSFRHIAQQVTNIDWVGKAAEAAHASALRDQQMVGQLSHDLATTAAVARTAIAEIEAAKAAALAAIGEAHAEGFIVEENLMLTDRLESESIAELLVRHQQRAVLSGKIRQCAANLAAVDEQAAKRILSGATVLRSVPVQSRHEPGTDPVQLVDYHSAPPPEKPSWTSPEPPPGGWSDDPITRAAQKIAYGHASTKHLANEWPPGTTREDLARVVERLMRSSIKPDSGLIVGRTVDGAPAIYDPKTITLVIRDSAAVDAGTVFRPTRGQAYLADKVPVRVPSLSTPELADVPARSPVDPPRPPRPGLPPMVGVPPMVDAPQPGAGEVPVLDSGGTPDVGLPGDGR